MRQSKPNTPLWQWFVFALGVIIIGSSLLRTLWHTYNSRNLLKEELQTVEQLEAEVAELKEKVQEATSSYTLEKRTRQELQLQKEGEVVIPVEH